LNKLDEKLADSKLLILYILQKINNPISYKELLELVISISDMNYFDFQQFLQDLLEDKFILKSLHNEEEIIELTNEGRYALDLTIDMLPGILKLKVDSSFKEKYNKIKDEFSVFAEYTPLTETNFSVKCKIIENNLTIFNLEANAGSREQAKTIVDNWNNHADDIYPQILNILTKQADT
jgi:predicted transcriptional regulator